jgi:Uma2 family endonuclease
MVTAALKRRSFTPKEYLTIERQADYKSEYLCGEIYAMAGATPTHNIITANVIRELGNRLKGTPCTTYASDMKVRTDAGGLFAYPDVTVGCGEPVFHDERGDVLTNPTIIVEVLSSSTADYDRSTKWEHYREIPSLQDYLMIAQETPRVEHYGRRSPDQWLFTTITNLEGHVILATHGLTLPLAEIYDRVVFATG